MKIPEYQIVAKSSSSECSEGYCACAIYKCYVDNMKILFIFSISIFFLGCASTGPKFSGFETLEDEEAMIYVMRPWRLYRGAATLDVLNNDRMVGDLPNGSYIPVNVAPGNGTITISASASAKFIGWTHDPLSVDYDIKPMEFKFIILDSPIEYFIPAGSSFLVGADIGLFEVDREKAIEVLPKLGISE